MYEIYLDFAKDYTITLPPYVKSYDVIMYDKSIRGDIVISNLNAKYRIRGNSSFAILSVLDVSSCMFDEASSELSIQQTLDEFMSFMQTEVVANIGIVQSVAEEKISFVQGLSSQSALAQSLTGLCKKEQISGSSGFALTAEASSMIVTGVSSSASVAITQSLSDIFETMYESIRHSTKLSSQLRELKLSHVGLSPIVMQIGASGATLAAAVYGDAVSGIGINGSVLETKLSLVQESASVAFEESVLETEKKFAAAQSAVSVDAELVCAGVGYLSMTRHALALDSDCSILAGHWQRVSEINESSMSSLDKINLSDIDCVFS